jgi:PleD family two-component response regulator
MGAGTHVFLNRIDRRLYRAKAAGRDRICDMEG